MMWFRLVAYVQSFLGPKLCVQLVMPGTWLSDLCQERYEVREKKASKKVMRFPLFLDRNCFG